MREMGLRGVAAKSQDVGQTLYGEQVVNGKTLPPPPPRPAPMTDEQIVQLLKSNPRRTEMSVDQFREVEGASHPDEAARDRARLSARVR